jgi:hypothetical protein
MYLQYTSNEHLPIEDRGWNMRTTWGHIGIAAWALNIVLLNTATSASADDYVTIQQGWSTKQKSSWYTRSQGSRLIPLSWLQALEQPDTDQLFLDDGYIQKFRYLPNYPATTEHLPIGFAIDQQDDRGLSNTQLRWKTPQSANEKWIGMNCAACHTAEITYKGKRMRIEGAPTLADFQRFMEALNKALVETRSDPEKAKRAANLNTPCRG